MTAALDAPPEMGVRDGTKMRPARLILGLLGVFVTGWLISCSAPWPTAPADGTGMISACGERTGTTAAVAASPPVRVPSVSLPRMFTRKMSPPR